MEWNLIGLATFLHFNLQRGGGVMLKNRGTLEEAGSILQVGSTNKGQMRAGRCGRCYMLASAACYGHNWHFVNEKLSIKCKFWLIL